MTPHIHKDAVQSTMKPVILRYTTGSSIFHFSLPHDSSPVYHPPFINTTRWVQWTWNTKGNLGRRASRSWQRNHEDWRQGQRRCSLDSPSLHGPRWWRYKKSKEGCYCFATWQSWFKRLSRWNLESWQVVGLKHATAKFKDGRLKIGSTCTNTAKNKIVCCEEKGKFTGTKIIQ